MAEIEIEGVAIHGEAAAGFEGVLDAFAANFARHGEIGAAFALHVGGAKVIDIWAGTADTATGRPWAEDTLQLVFSTTKGATAVCANILAERGELDVERPVADYWPEFAQAGKEQVPVRQLLTHEVGLPAVDGVVPIEDALTWHPLCARLAAQAPVWPPGSAHGYHALTYGYLVGEVVRRISGKSLGTFFADEVAGPLGLDFWVGLPAAEEPRMAPLLGTDPPADPGDAAVLAQAMSLDTMLGRALSGSGAFFPCLDPSVWNQARVHAAEVPAANGVTDARSLSRMYAALVGEVDGVRVLGSDQVERARMPLTTGPDQVLLGETCFGLGFMVSSPFSGFGGPGTFGHPGAGGSLGFADPAAGVGFGYVMNKMQRNLGGDPRTMGLIDAVYKAL